ncbi:MerR family transcriptional regulator [Paenibacillus puldeungensis]|uniref:MerR family transcriptional regulator n=1 Tax=Paenibacillus puldeungensis TaxID=696536 RepID=A0ABW3RTV6_9BACL
MKNEITISELAKLMNVSVHQIRYFEEKGILFPTYVDNNQYRMYGIDQVYELAQILLLRKLGLSVQSIKECLTSFAPDQVQQLLQQSLADTSAEIVRLQELQQFINKVLDEHLDFTNESQTYRVEWRKPIDLMCWFKMNASAPLHARLLAEQGGRIPKLFESDIHYVYDGSNSIAICTVAKDQGNLALPAGDHLTARFLIDSEADLEQKIAQFYDYAASHSFTMNGPLIVIEKSYLSLLNHNKLHYELLARIESTVTSECEEANNDRHRQAHHP